MRQVVLATEDALSEAVGCRLVDENGPDLGIAQTIRRGGFGYLKSKFRNFCEMARVSPVFLLTDLDSADCPATLIGDWSHRNVIPPQLVFRVAVRQVESWLLADREAMARFLKIAVRHIPLDPDALPDAKHSLLQVAARAPRGVRSELVADAGAIAAQGLGYNAMLCEFVRSYWDPSRAVARSNSLARARVRLSELASAG